MSVVTRLTTPTKSGVTATQVAADVTRFGGLAVAVLELVENTMPAVAPSAGVQAILAAVVGVLSAFLSARGQQQAASAAAAASVKASKSAK